ncbi:MAG: VacJ family lipoprotein [Desulfotignum sp.]
MKTKYHRLMGILLICLFTALVSPAWSDTTAPDNQVTAGQAVTKKEPLSDPFSEDDFFEEDLDDPDSRQVADPLYYFNYTMYVVNDRLYFYVLKPVATGYKTVMPLPARKGIRNFFHNLMFPIRFVNNLLQWKLEQASDEFGIFLVNSTAGILGFNQVAQKYLDMHTQSEDLGQTLGTYGIKEGFYLVLPLLGPSTLRDTLGLAGDYFLDPLEYVSPWEMELGLNTLKIINRTSFRIGDYERLKEAAIDPYSAFRNAYIQHRRMQIKQ